MTVAVYARRRARWRVLGEWFRPAPEILAAIELVPVAARWGVAVA